MPMGKRRSEEQASQDAERSSQAQADDVGAISGATSGATSGGGAVVLRLPRGLAVVLAAVLVLLIVLAYFAGRSQGYTAGQTAEREKLETINRLGARDAGGAAPLGRPGVRSGNAATAGNETSGGGGRVYLPGDADPRAAGENYPVLARYDLDEARRLADFLADKGVDTLVVSAHNAGLFLVVAVQGYTGEQFRSQQHLPFERRLRDLGRQWKIHNGNKGDDLSSLYWALYQPD